MSTYVLVIKQFPFLSCFKLFYFNFFYDVWRHKVQYLNYFIFRKETLRDWLRNTTVRNQSEILGFFYQICVGVEYVHR